MYKRQGRPPGGTPRRRTKSGEDRELATVGDSLLNGDRLVVKASARSTYPLSCVVNRCVAPAVTDEYVSTTGLVIGATAAWLR